MMRRLVLSSGPSCLSLLVTPPQGYPGSHPLLRSELNPSPKGKVEVPLPSRVPSGTDPCGRLGRIVLPTESTLATVVASATAQVAMLAGSTPGSLAQDAQGLARCLLRCKVYDLAIDFELEDPLLGDHGGALPTHAVWWYHD